MVKYFIKGLNILYLKSKFSQIKISSDLLENVCTSQFESAQYEYNKSILRFFIQNRNLDKLVPELKSSWIYLKVCTQANLKVIKANMKAIY